MTVPSLPSDFLTRLRRILTVSGVLFVSSFAGICGDDDDDDNGTGPSADCLDEIDFAESGFARSDVEPIGLGNTESGSITTSDVELDFGEIGVYYYDAYVFGAAESGDVSVEVDPAASFDADLAIHDVEWVQLDYQNEGGDGDVETSSGPVDEGACYLILISSSEAEATGSYTVRVE